MVTLDIPSEALIVSSVLAGFGYIATELVDKVGMPSGVQPETMYSNSLCTVLISAPPLHSLQQTVTRYVPKRLGVPVRSPDTGSMARGGEHMTGLLADIGVMNLRGEKGGAPG